MKLSASKLLDNLKKMKELEVSDIKQEHQKLMMITLGVKSAMEKVSLIDDFKLKLEQIIKSRGEEDLR